MKRMIVIIALLLVYYTSNAQYKNSIGLAFGSPSGISFKTFIHPDKALDFTLGGFYHFFTLTGMYEIHAPLAKDLKWYIGPGAHIGSWSGDKYGEGVFMGVDGVLGLEFNPKIPFVFSLDARPAFNFIGNQWGDKYHWFWWQSQFAIRYKF